MGYKLPGNFIDLPKSERNRIIAEMAQILYQRTGDPAFNEIVEAHSVEVLPAPAEQRQAPRFALRAAHGVVMQ